MGLPSEGGGGLPSHNAKGQADPLPRGQTDSCEKITFPQLCLLAVNITRRKVHSHDFCE